MAKVKFTAALRGEYQHLFDTCQVKPAKAADVERFVTSLLRNRARYEGVAKPLGIPWFVVGVIHHMECGQKFDAHLHNGDPLTARTRQEPKGRPPGGNPPFTWEASATDALVYDGLDAWDDWSIPGILYCLEDYNGWGYRLYHPEVKSPYLWSGSNHYVAGKYVADGTWSDTAVSAQCGAATLLRRLAEKGALDAASDADADLAAAMARKAPLFSYAPRSVTPGGVDLQRFLNGLPGLFLKEDGVLGPKTSLACEQVFGFRLRGDPEA